METRRKSNTEFRSEVTEILSRHETSFDTLTNNYNQLNSIIQTVITELQAICINSSTNLPPRNVHPLAPRENSNNTISPPHQNSSNVMYGRNQPHLKLNFPTFEGNDATRWIYKAEQYFEFKISFHLEGVALQWHRWFTKFKGPLTWDEFNQAVLQRFGPTDFQNPFKALTRLKQATTVTTYQETFKKLSYRVDDLSEKFLEGCFIVGFRDEIRLDVKIKQSSTLL
ncbi:hypothetical protein ACOSQ2_004174 [Xanthoceras sorbifolium]